MVVSAIDIACVNLVCGGRGLCEWRGKGGVWRGREGHLAIWTMGMDHVRAVCLWGIRQESRIELGRLWVPLLFWILTRMPVVRGRWRGDRSNIELGVVGSSIAGLGSGRGGELPVKARRVPDWGCQIGGHGW